jgi:hypothetical protein
MIEYAEPLTDDLRRLDESIRANARYNINLAKAAPIKLSAFGHALLSQVRDGLMIPIHPTGNHNPDYSGLWNLFDLADHSYRSSEYTFLKVLRYLDSPGFGLVCSSIVQRDGSPDQFIRVFLSERGLLLLQEPVSAQDSVPQFVVTWVRLVFGHPVAHIPRSGVGYDMLHGIMREYPDWCEVQDDGDADLRVTLTGFGSRYVESAHAELVRGRQKILERLRT